MDVSELQALLDDFGGHLEVVVEIDMGDTSAFRSNLEVDARSVNGGESQLVITVAK